MPENLQPDSMVTWMRSVEQRLAGLERPKASGTAALQVPMIGKPGEVVNVSSSSFTTTWEVSIPVVVADAVSIQFDVDVQGSGATAEAKLTNIDDDTDVLALTGGPQVVRFDWAPPDMEVYLGTEAYIVYVMVRYISGGGQATVSRPRRVIHGLSVDLDATADGNGRIV